jgi:hypothetical protein
VKTIVFTYGRYQPITTGHDKLLSKIMKMSRRLHADNLVCISQTHKLPRDPLPWKFKVSLFRQAYPLINICEDTHIKTPFQALQMLAEKGYERVVFVVGQDRLEQFSRMQGYALQWGIKQFRIISAGERDSSANGLVGMSATKLRSLAAHGEREAFMSGLPKALEDEYKELVYDNVRQTSSSISRNDENNGTILEPNPKKRVRTKRTVHGT